MKQDLSPDRQDLIQQLFAEITSALEVAHALAATGQSHGLSSTEYAHYAARVQVATGDATTLAAAIPVLLCPTVEHTDDGR